MSIEEDVKWFEDHGWYVCGDCEGHGELESEVDLLDVLPELLNEIEKRKLQV